MGGVALIYVTLSRQARRRILLLLCVAMAFLFGWPVTWKTGESIPVRSRLLPLRFVSTREKVLTLTFDVTWGHQVLPLVLEVLKDRQVPATFFVSGTWAATHPDLLRRIVAEGHEVGNHTQKHLNLSQQPKEVIVQNIRQAHDLIKELTGLEPFLFRPPNGDYDDLVISTALEMGYTTVIWGTDSLDWKNPGAEYIVRRVVGRAHPGDIVLLHASDSARQTPEALPRIIEGLKAKGYKTVRLSDLLKLETD